MAGLLLDTHTWLWLESGIAEIRPAARAQMEKAATEHRLFLSAISLLELANMYRRGRITLPIPLEIWLDQSLSQPGISLLPLTPPIAVETTRLPHDFQGDPADRLIASTARVHQLTLCTRDKALLRFGRQGLYRTLTI